MQEIGRKYKLCRGFNWNEAFRILREGGFEEEGYSGVLWEEGKIQGLIGMGTSKAYVLEGNRKLIRLFESMEDILLSSRLFRYDPEQQAEVEATVTADGNRRILDNGIIEDRRRVKILEGGFIDSTGEVGCFRERYANLHTQEGVISYDTDLSSLLETLELEPAAQNTQ